MDIAVDSALVILGFAFLIFFADILIKGGIGLATYLRLDIFFVSMTVIAFGTSLPELFISLNSNLRSETEFVVSNIVGSNISNILLVIGFGALLKSIRFPLRTIFKDIPFSIGITIALGIFVNLHVQTKDDTAIYIIDRFEAMLFMMLFIFFIRKLWHFSKEETVKKVRSQNISLTKSIMFILFGSLGLYFGGELVISGCVDLGNHFDINHSFIGLTIIALGTSLPELITSVYAIFKQEEDIAIGNVLGSNVFNILWVLGLTSLVYPIKYEQNINHDIFILIFVNSILCILLYISRKHALNRYNGFLFVCSYFFYAYFAYVRIHQNL